MFAELVTAGEMRRARLMTLAEIGPVVSPWKNRNASIGVVFFHTELKGQAAL